MEKKKECQKSICNDVEGKPSSVVQEKRLVMHSMIPLSHRKTETRNVIMFIHDDMNKEKGAQTVHTSC